MVVPARTDLVTFIGIDANKQLQYYENQPHSPKFMYVRVCEFGINSR